MNLDNNVSYDASADDFTGTGNVINQTSYANYFTNGTAGSENFHLLSDSLTLWGTYGADVDTDLNLPVTLDIDGEARDGTNPDIGGGRDACFLPSGLFALLVLLQHHSPTLISVPRVLRD